MELRGRGEAGAGPKWPHHRVLEDQVRSGRQGQVPPPYTATTSPRSIRRCGTTSNWTDGPVSFSSKVLSRGWSMEFTDLIRIPASLSVCAIDAFAVPGDVRT